MPVKPGDHGSGVGSNTPVLSQVKRHETTVVAIAPAHLRLGQSPGELPSTEPFRYKIRIARKPLHFDQADQLVQKMYGSRGYQVQATGPDGVQLPTVCLLVYDEDNRPVGTVTAGFGNPDLLRADELYGPELKGLRRHGWRVMEMTRFAIDSHGVQSARIQAALFNLSYLCGKLAQRNFIVIELNPRHVAYYRKFFGFKLIGPERVCPRVDAPAVLLGLDFGYIAKQVALCAGKPEEDAAARKSLYRHFMGDAMEDALAKRLLAGSAFDRFREPGATR